MKTKFYYILFPAITLLFGSIIGFLTAKNISGWYMTLNKPEWNPPNWVFAPVWSILYILMGIALAKYVSTNTVGRKKDLGGIFFIVQFILNLAWSLIFFNFRNISLAFYEIILMGIFIILTILQFYKINKTSAYLMIPYLLWVTFATFLTYNVWRLNS